MSVKDRRVWRRFSSASVAAALFLCWLLVLPVAGSSLLPQEGTVPCLSSSDTLEDLVYCFYDYVPDRYSKDGRDGFDVPTAEEMTQWRQVVERMMNGECETIDLSGYDWGGDFTVTAFTDAEASSTYCIFMETRYETYPDPAGPRLTHGWGTLVYNPLALRELSIAAPHIKYDAWTDRQAAGIFKRTRSRTLLMNGAHRYASDVSSDCQADGKRSDAAHNTQHMFYATVAGLMEYYDGRGVPFYHLQFHGMGSSSCPGVDVYLTHGLASPPVAGDKVLELRSNLIRYHPTWIANVPGESPECHLNGTTNVEGRLLNGVPGDQVCGTEASGYSGHFIHIEQHYDYRHAEDWFEVISDAWPVTYFPLVIRDAATVGWQSPLR